MSVTMEARTLTDWYDTSSVQTQELYDAICERISWFDKCTIEEVSTFIDQLSDLGIDTASDFEDRLFTELDSSYRPEEDFAQHYVEEIMDSSRLLNDCGLLSILSGCIDYEAVYNSSLRYDLDYIEICESVLWFTNA